MLSRINFGWTLVRLKKHWITLFYSLMNGPSLKTMWKYRVFFYFHFLFLMALPPEDMFACVFYLKVSNKIYWKMKEQIQSNLTTKKKKEAYLWESKFFAKSISRNHSKFFYYLDNEQGRRIWILESGYF